MKKKNLKVVALIMLVITLFAVSTTPVKANTNEKIILEKANEEFLIYYKNVCNEEFEFAFSKTEKGENLNYLKSAKDQLTENALNVVYVDKAIYDEFFKENNDNAYLWIRDNNEEVKVKADLINLKDSLNDKIINEVKTMTIVDKKTDRIEVDTTKTVKTETKVEDKDVTVTVGKVIVKGKENAKYAYELLKVTDKSKAQELFNLAENLKENIKDTYKNLELTKNFYELYLELTPKEKEWNNLETLEIMQPENTIEGDKYIVYLKEEKDNKTVIDAKFLNCVRKEEKGEEVKQEIVDEVVKLPVTFDTGIILFIVLVIIAIALVAMLLLKNKSNKKNEKK